jgi:hypothetical protein
MLRVSPVSTVDQPRHKAIHALATRHARSFPKLVDTDTNTFSPRYTGKTHYCYRVTSVPKSSSSISFYFLFFYFFLHCNQSACPFKPNKYCETECPQRQTFLVRDTSSPRRYMAPSHSLSYCLLVSRRPDLCGFWNELGFRFFSRLLVPTGHVWFRGRAVLF